MCFQIGLLGDLLITKKSKSENCGILVRENGGSVNIQPIGTIHSPFTNLEDMPIQPTGASGIKGTVEVLEDFAEGLQDLDGFSHIILLYVFHKSQGFKLRVYPFMDKVLRGVFATRAPKRPSPIGISVVRLEKVAGRVLHIDGVDILDGTPLIDIKPYVPDFDPQGEVRTGWLGEIGKTAQEKRSDDRFK